MHATLADMFTDLVQNSVEAGAARIVVTLDEGSQEIRFVLEDNGRGMDEETLARAADPFFTDGKKHPGRRVGLGIPFLRQTAQQTGGRATVASQPGHGTRVEAVFPAGHLDLPPLGDPVLLWMQCLMFEGDYDMEILRVRRKGNGERRSYQIDRAQLADAAGGLEDTGSMGLIREYLVSLEQSVD